MARQYAVDDSKWIEVKVINGYALFMGYLMMGVRGLGLLVITWTTVVLLGGFVSDLEKMDFWCLTGISLIQTAGVFNFLLTEKINDMVHLGWGLLGAAAGTIGGDTNEWSIKRIFLAYAVSAIQGVVLFVLLCPVAILYLFGIYLSAGASLWRLIKHDFGNDGGANMKPALQVLYSLAVAQGAFFSYKTIHSFSAKNGLVKLVYNALEKDVDEELIEEYLKETVAGCEQDPSFANGRNLITYGMDLMEANKSNEAFIVGIKVLGGAIRQNRAAQMVLAKCLLTRSDSSSAIIQRLLETVGPRSPYSRKIKEHVLRILEIIAPCIRLEKFPRAIDCLCSVVDTTNESRGYGNNLKDNEELSRYGDKFKDYLRVELLEEYEKYYIKRDHEIGFPDLLYQCLPCKTQRVKNGTKKDIIWGFDQLLIKAVNIIHKIIADEYNKCIILRTSVSKTMLNKIAMLPTKLHRESHYPCRLGQKSNLQMLEQCWVLTEWFSVALTDTSSPSLQPAATPVGEGQQRKRSEEIEEEVEEDEEQLLVLRTMDGSALGCSFKRTIRDGIESTIKCIFDCLDCGLTQKRQAIQILLHLSLDMSSIVQDSESRKRRLSWILLLILISWYWTAPSLTDDSSEIDKLARQKLSEILPEKHEQSRRELSIHLVLDLKRAFHGVDDISTRIHAVIIMEGLCDSFQFEDNEDVVKKFLFDEIQEVVKATLNLCGPITEERQEQATDVEKGNVSQDNQDGCIDTQRLRKALGTALASLCYFGYLGDDIPSLLRSRFEDIASQTCMEERTTFKDFKGLLRQSLSIE